MTTSTASSVPDAPAGAPARALAAIFWGGLLAAIFDITQAFIGFGFLGAKPLWILQHIAGGVFGARSMQMGWTSALLGLIFHFTIAFTAAAVYYLASRTIRVMVEHAVLCGLLYGEFVFLFIFCGVTTFCPSAAAFPPRRTSPDPSAIPF